MTTKIQHPTRKEIIGALKEEQSLEDFDNYILIIEKKKVSDNIGLFGGELLQNDKIIARGKVTIPPNTPDWNELELGESSFQGFCLDLKGESLSEIITEGIKNRLKDGKLPFFP